MNSADSEKRLPRKKEDRKRCNRETIVTESSEKDEIKQKTNRLRNGKKREGFVKKGRRQPTPLGGGGVEGERESGKSISGEGKKNRHCR